ncbi:MAG: helical backbone metal receptor [Acidimicrobiales bacterium]
MAPRDPKGEGAPTLRDRSLRKADVRIVSLVPSVTETLSAWDRTPIACTRFCERPDLAHVGGTKNPNIERIVELRPDLVVVDQEENRREDYEMLLEQGLEVHVLHVVALDDVNPSLAALADRVKVSFQRLAWPEPRPHRFSAFTPIWRRPWMALGEPTYGSSVLSHLGVTNAFAGEGPYPVVQLDDARGRHPDVILVPSEPYSFTADHVGELDAVAPTKLIDGQDLFWWGVRTPDAISRLDVVLGEP